MKSYKKLSFFLLLLFGTVLFSGCEDDTPGYNQEKEYALDGFTHIDMGSAFKVEIIHADEFAVMAKGEGRDLDDLELTVSNNTLKGKYQRGSGSHGQTFIQIHMPALRTASLHNATSTVIKGFYSEEDSLRLLVSEASEVKTSSDWKFIELELSGASDLILEGKADAVKGSVSGASDLYAEDLSSVTFEINVKGASEAYVNVQNRLSGSVKEDSKLVYRGDPAVVEVDVDSGSNLQKK